MVSGSSNDDLLFLKNEFLREAKIIDLERGYISASSFNLRMKPSVLAAAAQCIAKKFNSDNINCVHGIPHSGNFLATAVALAIGNSTRIHSSRKDQNVPSTWKDIYRQEVRSFTTSNSGMTVFAGINLSFVLPGDNILLVDDVCATGETGTRIVEGLLKRGVRVAGFAVLFDKVFQGGVDEIAKLGVKVFSCVRVLSIGPRDRIELMGTTR